MNLHIINSQINKNQSSSSRAAVNASKGLTCLRCHSYMKRQREVCRLFFIILSFTLEKSPFMPQFRQISRMPLMMLQFEIYLLWMRVFRVSRGVVTAETKPPRIKAGKRFIVKFFIVKLLSLLMLSRYSPPIAVFLKASSMDQNMAEYIISLAKVTLYPWKPGIKLFLLILLLILMRVDQRGTLTVVTKNLEAIDATSVDSALSNLRVPLRKARVFSQSSAQRILLNST